jgi:threonine dehydrogenase-like Zn-dependent dehydrogenase
MTRLGHSAVFTAPGKPLEYWHMEVPDPPSGGLLIRMEMAGVCGTDAHRLAGHLPHPGRPVVFGHEGVGRVEVLGSGVTTDLAGEALRAGDLVYWNPITSCHRCYSCNIVQDVTVCPHAFWPAWAQTPNAAAFQEYATLTSETEVFRVPEGVPPEAVVAFGCAMPTAIEGIQRLGGIETGAVVVIQGSGPVGLASTLLAGLSAARHVVVVGAPDNRLRAAERLGATVTMSIESTIVEQRAEIIRDLSDGRGADIVIEAAGALPAFDEGISLLARNGRYLILGLFSGSGTVNLNPFRLNNLNLRIIGSFGVQPQARRRMIQLVQRYHEELDLPALITHRFPLENTAEAIASVGNGSAIKAVVTPGDGIAR